MISVRIGLNFICLSALIGDFDVDKFPYLAKTRKSSPFYEVNVLR